MTDEKTVSVAGMDDEGWRRRFEVERQRSEILERESRELIDHLAEARVQVSHIDRVLVGVSRERDEVEYKRQIAYDTLAMAAQLLVAAHKKSAPSHDQRRGCEMCGQIQLLNRQLVRSERLPESRMALAS